MKKYQMDTLYVFLIYIGNGEVVYKSMESSSKLCQLITFSSETQK